MTIPRERIESLERARQFLYELLDRRKTPRVPMEIRERAGCVLRHFPYESEYAFLADNLREHLAAQEADRGKAD